MMERYTQQAREALGLTVGMVESLNHGYVDTEHLLIGLLREGTSVATKVLEDNEVEEDRVIELVSQLIAPNPTIQTTNQTVYTPRAHRVIKNSYREAVRFKAAQIGTEHTPIAILREGDYVASKFLSTIGVSIQKLYIDLLTVMEEDAPAVKDDISGAKGGRKSNAIPALDSYSRDLTQLAVDRRLDPVVGREQEIQRVIQILSHRTKNNPCPIGEPGVGKTAAVEGLAQMIVSGNVPETITDKGVMTLDLSGMVAGSKYRGEFEERIKKAIFEVIDSGDVLLFIDEIHTIIGAGGAEGTLGASDILKPSPARGELQLIGATTISEYRKYIEKDSALERRFQPVTVDEPTEDESVATLRGLYSHYEEHHKVEITDEALAATVKLSSRYINDRFSPNKAIDLIDETSSRVRLANYTKPPEIKEYEEGIETLEGSKEEAIKKEAYKKAGEIKSKQEKLREKINQTVEKWQKEKEIKKLLVSDNEIADVVSGWTGIPVRKLAKEESERLKNPEGILHQCAVGQEEAVTVISKAIRGDRIGLKNPGRPIDSFLFLGPTGIGKTELSKALSEVVFGTGNALIQVDMSEHMEKHSVSKMIGSPPGYAGYDEGGQLSKKVRRNPYSVILFDEIEKAHPDMFNILLQVLDDRHITDVQGRKIDFKNTVIIITSNVGAGNIISLKRLGFGVAGNAKADYTFMKERVTDEVKRLFKPEFLDRIDEIIVFRQLSKDHIKGITDIMLSTIGKRSKGQLGIELTVTSEAREYLIDKDHDEKYGVRPLRHTIQNLMEDEMAEEMLDDSIKAGDTVQVGFDGEKLTFTSKSKAAPKRRTSGTKTEAAKRDADKTPGKKKSTAVIKTQ